MDRPCSPLLIPAQFIPTLDGERFGAAGFDDRNPDGLGTRRAVLNSTDKFCSNPVWRIRGGYQIVSNM
jgi:hypothetical protein